MMRQIIFQKHCWAAAAAVLALAAVLVAGCKQQQPAAPTDQQLTSGIQAKIQGESALDGQNIQVSVQNGEATLSGTVSDDASRALAGNDSGAVNGVKTVVNNLTVQPMQMGAAAPQPAPATQNPHVAEHRARHEPEHHHQAEHRQLARNTPPPPPQQVAPPSRQVVPPPQPQQQPQQASMPPAPPLPAAPAPAPRLVVRQLTLDAGTIVPVRLTEGLDTKTAQPNDMFHGTLADDLISDGVVAIPRGSPVLGQVVEAREAAHFKGNSFLSIQLTQVTVHGRKIGLDTDTYSKEGTGRGKNTAEKAGGGALFGSLVGALAGGGKGAAIGALAGGAAGTGINAATRGQQVQIPSESVIDFRLESPIVVTVTTSPSRARQNDQNGDPQLQRR